MLIVRQWNQGIVALYSSPISSKSGIPMIMDPTNLSPCAGEEVCVDASHLKYTFLSSDAIYRLQSKEGNRSRKEFFVWAIVVS